MPHTTLILRFSYRYVYLRLMFEKNSAQNEVQNYRGGRYNFTGKEGNELLARPEFARNGSVSRVMHVRR